MYALEVEKSRRHSDGKRIKKQSKKIKNWILFKIVNKIIQTPAFMSIKYNINSLTNDHRDKIHNELRIEIENSKYNFYRNIIGYLRIKVFIARLKVKKMNFIKISHSK